MSLIEIHAPFYEVYMRNQEKMPFVEALESYKEQHFVPFHTPGHKIGV